MTDLRPTLAIYGGSFSPPHMGHAFMLSWLHWTQKAGRVVLVPSYSHPLGKDLAPWEGRMRMAQALVDACGAHWAEVSPIEAEREGPSYTIDTLDYFAAKYPRCRIQPVFGSDILNETHRWKHWDRIEANYTPIIVPRGVGGITPDISSTMIRDKIARGESVDDLVPATVLEVLNPEWFRR